MQAVTHQTIETRAYELWEAAGRPFGRSEEFWFLATTELATPPKVKKAAAPKARAAAAKTSAGTKSKAAPAAAAKPKKKATGKKAG
jgi:hypothetical protein